MGWRHSDKQKYFRHIRHWKAKRLKKKRTKQVQKQRTKQNISYSFQHSVKQWKFPNSSSHTVINRQEDVITETVFIEGLTKIFFSLISNNKLFWCEARNHFWYCQFLSVELNQCGMYFELRKGTCLPITWHCFSSGKLLASSCEELAYNLAKDIILVAFLIGNKHRFPCGKSWQKHNRRRDDPTSQGVSLQSRCSFKAWMCGRLPLGLPDSTLATFWSRI